MDLTVLDCQIAWRYPGEARQARARKPRMGQ